MICIVHLKTLVEFEPPFVGSRQGELTCSLIMSLEMKFKIYRIRFHGSWPVSDRRRKAVTWWRMVPDSLDHHLFQNFANTQPLVFEYKYIEISIEKFQENISHNQDFKPRDLAHVLQ